MIMKSTALTLAAAMLLSGCAAFDRNHNPYEKAPFYAQFLNTGSELDARMRRTLDELRANPRSAALHNDLGAMLMAKDFPNDAQREFERAINSDSDFYPAWYNLGLVRAAQGNSSGAKRAFRRTVSLRKGHPPALFQLGLMAEKSGDSDTAIDYYAKAFRHNPAMLDVRVNPSILDSKLTHLALLRKYDRDRHREGAIFEPAYPGYQQPVRTAAPSPQAEAADIVTPSAPVTDPATQTTAPKP